MLQDWQRLFSSEGMELFRRSGQKKHVEFQNNSWETVLLAVEGLNQLIVEQALNAALSVIRDAVNKAIGFALL